MEGAAEVCVAPPVLMVYLGPELDGWPLEEGRIGTPVPIGAEEVTLLEGVEMAVPEGCFEVAELAMPVPLECLIEEGLPVPWLEDIGAVPEGLIEDGFPVPWLEYIGAVPEGLVDEGLPVPRVEYMGAVPDGLMEDGLPVPWLE